MFEQKVAEVAEDEWREGKPFIPVRHNSKYIQALAMLSRRKVALSN